MRIFAKKRIFAFLVREFFLNCWRIFKIRTNLSADVSDLSRFARIFGVLKKSVKIRVRKFRDSNQIRMIRIIRNFRIFFCVLRTIRRDPVLEREIEGTWGLRIWGWENVRLCLWLYARMVISVHLSRNSRSSPWPARPGGQNRPEPSKNTWTTCSPRTWSPQMLDQLTSKRSIKYSIPLAQLFFGAISTKQNKRLLYPVSCIFQWYFWQLCSASWRRGVSR